MISVPQTPNLIFLAGSKALTNATAGVVLESDQPCAWVDISCAGGIMAVGDSASTRADSSAHGIILTPGSTPYRIYCTNLNKVYVSGLTGTRAAYVYYTYSA